MPTFDPNQPFEEVAVADAPKFNPDQPFEPVSEGEQWKPLYSGLDQAPMDPAHAQALDYLGRKLGDDKETRAAAINQSYVQSKMPDWSLNVMQQNWPTIRDQYAKEAGFTQGEPITDSGLYGHIQTSIDEEGQKGQLVKEVTAISPDKRAAFVLHNFGHLFSLNAAEWWRDANKPFKEIPAAPQMPNLPALGFGNPAIAAGVYNSVIKPLVEGLETPLGVATLGTTSELSAAKSAGLPLAKEALAGISGLFAGMMAKSAAEKVPETIKVLKDPNATLQQQIEAVGAPLSELTLGILAGFHGVAELAPESLSKVKGKTPEEAAQVLRQEANATTEPAAREVMIDVASKLDEIPSVKTPEQMVAENKEAMRQSDMEGEAPTTETSKVTPAEASKQFGIKEASINKELAKSGEELVGPGEVISDKEAMKTATETLRADPEAGQKLVDELAGENPRAINTNEVVLLGHEWTRLNLELERNAKLLDDAVKAGDEAKVSEATDALAKIREDRANTAEVIREATGNQGRAFRAIQFMVKEDYSLGAMEQQRFEARGGEKLSPEHLKEVADLHAKIAESDAKVAETQKALTDLQAKMSDRLVEDESARKPVRGKPPSKVLEKLSKQADLARERIKQRLTEGRVSSGIDPALLADHAIVAADYVARGVKTVADLTAKMVKEFGEDIRPYMLDIFDKAKKTAEEAKRLEAYKTRTQTSTKDFQRRIKESDFSAKEKKTALELDEAARRAQAENKQVKEEFQTLKDRDLYEKSSKIEKIKQQGLALYDASRLLMTTGEFSFILRQGKVGVLSHPIMAAKVLPDMFKAFVADPAGAHAINLKILNHPDAAAAKAAKLHLVEEGASLNKQEEFLMSKLVETNPVLVNTVGRFNRAATVFLNRLRFDMWQTMRESSGGLNAAEQKQLATFVNEATGRGSLGALEPAAVPLGRIMFAPRYLASRLQLATGHSLWGGTWETRRIIAKEYAKTLVGLGAYYSALYVGLNALAPDDKKVEIGTDPRSSDFGKVKIGNTRLDPLAGLAQVITFSARTATGETVSSKGKEHDIRGDNVPYGGEKWSDVAARFARSKLHPVPGAVINLFDGTDLGGNKADITNQALNLSGPLTYVDVYQALEEQDLPEGVALGILTMLGEGLQTYDANKKHPKKKN